MKLKDKKILVGVTGGIAVYKTCTLVNMLISEGADVRVVMTDNAKKFVTPLTFQALTNRVVYEDIWKSTDQNTIEHISLSHWADLIVVSPITANTIGKIVHGLADNLLTTLIIASLPHTKIVLAPAMNNNMWDSLFVQENIKKLRDHDQYVLIEPRSGILACRDEGKGNIASNEEIIKTIESLL
ncbi:MAG: bifunctional phosphopantothenoylcysteine decarboxylase/phosphopantothenate--cysteine ligase CoaBC [Candidatus Taylorbacteria bacterium]